MTGLSFGRPPKKLIRPCRAVICTACSWAAPAAVAVMTTSAPRPSVSLSTASTTSVSAPQIAASGWTRLAARSRRSRLRSTRNTRAAPRARARRTCRQPIGPGAHDDHVVALPHTGEVLAVEDAGEGLSDGRLGEAESLGDPVEPVDGEDVVRHDHVFGEPAVEVVSHRHLVGAHGHPAAPALGARTASDGGDDLDPVPGPPVGDVTTDLDDLAGDLVAHDAGRGDVVVAEAGDLHVGAAGGAVPGRGSSRRWGPPWARALPRCGRHRVRGIGRPSRWVPLKDGDHVIDARRLS